MRTRFLVRNRIPVGFIHYESHEVTQVGNAIFRCVIRHIHDPEAVALAQAFMVACCMRRLRDTGGGR